jgi:hypothetical protein
MGKKMRLALCVKPSRCEGLVYRSRFCSAATRPISLRVETSGWKGAFFFGGAFDCARMMFIHRWRELWPRSAQDDILKKQVFDFAPPIFVCEQHTSELRCAKGEMCRLRSGELHRRACGSEEGASRRFFGTTEVVP